jgi:tetratricopeptide (TPR) repeat protein
MGRWRPKTWLAGMTVLVLAALACWYLYGPAHQRNQAMRLLAAGKPDEAEPLLRKLARQHPDQITLELHARSLRRLGRAPEALPVLERAVQAGLPESEARREQMLLVAEDHFAQMEHGLLEALSARPNDTDIIETLARCYARAGRWPDAEKHCTRLLENEPGRTDILLARARARQEQKRFDQAVDDFREAVRRRPDDFDARLLFAQCLLTDAHVQDTEAQLQECRRLRPDRPEPLIGLASCAIEQRDWRTAEQLLEEALARDHRSVQALHELGFIRLERGDGPGAIAVFTRILQIDPRDKQAHWKLAQALRQGGQTEQARLHVRRFQELEQEEKQVSQAKISR